MVSFACFWTRSWASLLRRDLVLINGIGLVLRIWAYDALFVIGSSFCELDQSWLIPWEFSLFSSFVPCRNICSSWIPAIRSWCENDLFPKFSASTFAEGARKWKAKPSNIFQESQPVSFCFCSYVAVIILESFSYCSRTSLHKNRCLYSPRKSQSPVAGFCWARNRVCDAVQYTTPTVTVASFQAVIFDKIVLMDEMLLVKSTRRIQSPQFLGLWHCGSVPPSKTFTLDQQILVRM